MATSESLILREQAEAEAAPCLFSHETIAEITEAERRGEYTLERLRERRPEVIDEIIRLRGQWTGMLRIGKLCRVHHRTVSAVCAAYPEEIHDEQQKRVKRLRSAADKLVELVDDDPQSVPPNVRGLVASQLYDKAQLFNGEATSRTEHVEHINIFERYQLMIADLRKELQETAGGATENPIDIAAFNASETGFDSGKKSVITEPTSEVAALPGSWVERGS